jgi:hypothetical protein
MLPTHFQFAWLSGFIGEDYLGIDQSATRIPSAGHFLLTNRDELSNSNLYGIPSIDATYQVLVHLDKWFKRGKCFRNRPISNNNCLWRACLLTDRGEIGNLYRRPAINASYQVSLPLSNNFQRRRFFRNQPISDTNCLWWPCLLTDRDEISNLYGVPFIDATY